jgi:transposase
MHSIITAKLKLHPTPEQFRALRQTQLAYLDALNFVSRYAFAQGKPATVKQRRANRHASQWAFAELHGYVACKALLSDGMAVKVNAYTTSQACSRCGYTSPENCPKQVLLFACHVCHLILYAGLAGARNVALRTLLARQDWARPGVLSERPDVSDDAAKAVRRRRYAELRWSPDTSPRA